MTAPAPYGYAQPDALAFLDQPLADFDSVLQTQPLQALGDSAVDSYITLPYAQTPAWSQSPGFKDAGALPAYGMPSPPLQYAAPMAAAAPVQLAMAYAPLGAWPQDDASMRTSSHDTVHHYSYAAAAVGDFGGSPADLNRRSGAPTSSSGQDSLQGALAAVKQEDEEEEVQETQRASAAATRTRQHNRSAQRRYREKQKAKLADSDQRVAELTEQIRTLHMQKESLALRNALLEKLVSMRAAQAASGGASVVQAAPAAWWLDAPTRLLLEDMLGLGPTVTISVRPGLPPTVLTQQQVVDSGPEEYQRTWQQYINAFAEALIAAGADDAASPAGKRVDDLLAEAFRFQCTMVLARPEWAHAMHMHTSLSGAHSRQPGAAEALRLLNLRPQQRTMLLELRKLYVRNLAGLVTRREQLMAVIQAASNAETDSRLTGIVKADDLRDVLREEHSLWCQFQLCVWRQILSPFQAVSLMLQSHPAKADTMAVLEVLAAESGQPSYAKLMADAAARPTEDIPPLDAALALVPRCLANVGCSGGSCGK